MPAPLILVSNSIRGGTQSAGTPADDSAPRQDFVEIMRLLGGSLVGRDTAPWYRYTRRLEQRVKLDLAAALYAAARCTEHNVILTMSEKIALPLAAMLSLARRDVPHITIAHKLSSGMKTHLLRAWRLDRTFTRIICLCKAQADYMTNQLGLPRAQIEIVYDKVDQRFFRPLGAESQGYILAVGQEQRDYQTLLRAIAGTDLKLVVVASSPWSTSALQVAPSSQVIIRHQIPYRDLRDLYARARLVVVPLFENDYAAGVNGVLEAMAMAKPLIVSRTQGIADYITPGETCVGVAPERPDELREAILSVWDRPGQLARLGANARQIVETRMNMDIYAERVAQIVGAAVAGIAAPATAAPSDWR